MESIPSNQPSNEAPEESMDSNVRPFPRRVTDDRGGFLGIAHSDQEANDLIRRSIEEEREAA